MTILDKKHWNPVGPAGHKPSYYTNGCVSVALVEDGKTYRAYETPYPDPVYAVAKSGKPIKFRTFIGAARAAIDARQKIANAGPGYSWDA